MHFKYTSSCYLLRLQACDFFSTQIFHSFSKNGNNRGEGHRVAREHGLHNVCNCASSLLLRLNFKQCSHFHFFFFISSSFASFFLFRKASRSSKVWAPGMILEGLARGETLLLLFPPTASITLFITVSIPLNSSLTATETSAPCIKALMRRTVQKRAQQVGT